MANETTTSSLEEIINSEFIRPVFADYAHEFVNAVRFCQKQSLVGKSSKVWAQPRPVSDMGAVGAGGSGVATAFDAVETTALVNLQLDTAETTITTAEYGVLRAVSDSALEDLIDGFALIQWIVRDSARILMTALEDDVIALAGSLTNTTGTSGVNLSVANVTDAIAAIRNRGVRAPGGLAAVLSDTQMGDFEDALEGTSTSTAIYPGAADRMLGAQPGPNNGMDDGLVLVFKGTNFYQSGLVDTANSAADDVGFIVVNGGMPVNQDFSAFGLAESRAIRAETERNAASRLTEVVVTARWGVGILAQDSGQALITDT